MKTMDGALQCTFPVKQYYWSWVLTWKLKNEVIHANLPPVMKALSSKAWLSNCAFCTCHPFPRFPIPVGTFPPSCCDRSQRKPGCWGVKLPIQWAQVHTLLEASVQWQPIQRSLFYKRNPRKAMLSEHQLLPPWQGKHSSHERNLTSILNPARNRSYEWSETSGHCICRVCNEQTI